jgi:hypothetical protein
MTFGPGPIGAEAARWGLTADEIAAAGREDVRVEQAKLNEEELRELERPEYYDEPAAPLVATGAPGQALGQGSSPTGILDRLRALLRMGRWSDPERA